MHYFAAWTDLMHLFAVPVDLVRVEEALSSLQMAVINKTNPQSSPTGR